MEAAHDGGPALGCLHDGSQQQRPLVVLEHWTLAHGGRDFDDRLALDKTFLDPLLGELVHPPKVDLVVVVERGGYRGYRPLDKIAKLCSIHAGLPVSLV